ncbi:hypothetical protein J1N35_023653 [Gossypium stocksii]|uniref:DUF4283 domain-containing protein n=1 Tax=Gossypium stocksii TaxID=47602 RepID=A0A9D3VKF1_9ROSI|nr:hypothetical protein J1N35_023653 [Gossypium stocksii]
MDSLRENFLCQEDGIGNSSKEVLTPKKKRIHQLLTKDMENTIVLKLLGRNIGYSVLHNKIYSIWKPQFPFKLIDIENEYFLVKFQNKFDCEKVLSEGPWIIFDH